MSGPPRKPDQGVQADSATDKLNGLLPAERAERSDSWHPFEAKHWIVAAQRPARIAERAVDARVGYSRAKHKSKPRHFTTNGVRATVLTGDIAAPGFASANHAIVY